MAKTRETPRHDETRDTKAKKPWPQMTREQFVKEAEAFFYWTGERTRSEVSWWQSLREYANVNFDKAYEEATK